MPHAEERKRGGVLRYRTKSLPGNKYVHLAVTRKAGPQGGHTLAGPTHTRKTTPKRAGSRALFARSRNA